MQAAARARPDDIALRLRALRAVREADLTWADAVLLAVPDGAIANAAESLAARVGRTPVLHLSGNRPFDEAGVCREHGALHPLASFASSKAPPSLEGVHFALSGTPSARQAGERIARALGGHVLQVRRGERAGLHGSAYHASAALVANGAAALAAGGVDILTRLGVSRARAQRAVAGLLRTVAHNVEHVGVPAALTGPVVRGDAVTVGEHRAALAKLGGGGLAVYDAIAHAIVACAVDAGLPTRAAEGVRRILTSPPGAAAKRTPKAPPRPR
jgi:predicted short-subunit dehydrogenase-like oxidoreductase (DUF2520 family)